MAERILLIVETHVLRDDGDVLRTMHAALPEGLQAVEALARGLDTRYAADKGCDNH